MPLLILDISDWRTYSVETSLVISDEWGAETMLDDSDVLADETSIDVSTKFDDFVSLAIATLPKLLVSVVVLWVSTDLFHPSPFIKS